MARRRRGMTKLSLSQEVGISVRSLAGYFRSEREPDQETVYKFAKTLNFPVEFFYGDELDEIPEDSPSFRALSKLTARQRDQAIAAGTLGVCLADWIERHFTLPEPTIPKYEKAEPEVAAMEVRELWGLRQRPIRNIVHLLELHGVRVFSLAEDTLTVDAFSLWRGETPLIFLNTRKSAERSRMDAAHELGHLVLHSRSGSQRDREAEREAQLFGAAFLMPRGSVLSRVERNPSLDQIIEHKFYWKVSVANLTYRLHQLGLLTRHQYSRTFVEIGKLNYRTDEPLSIDRETSQVLGKVFEALQRRGVTVPQVAKELAIHPDELGKLLVGLVGFPLILA